MKTQTVLDYTIKDIERLSEKELRQAVSVVRSTARKRYERLVDAEISSPAMRGIMSKSPDSDKVFPTVKGMDTTTLRNELQRYSKFINAKTSTKSGAISYNKRQKDIISEIVGEDLTDAETVEFWELYEEAKENGAGGVLNYEKVQKAVGEVYKKRRKSNGKKKTARTLLRETKKRLDKIYEDENAPAKVYTSQYIKNDPN